MSRIIQPLTPRLHLRQWAEGDLGAFAGMCADPEVMRFSPCVEVLWRLARPYWGNGYATEAAEASLQVGFEQLKLEEIVSFAVLENRRSRAVMERIGMTDTGRDFDHPALPETSPLRRHCLYSMTRQDWRRKSGSLS